MPFIYIIYDRRGTMNVAFLSKTDDERRHGTARHGGIFAAYCLLSFAVIAAKCDRSRVTHIAPGTDKSPTRSNVTRLYPPALSTAHKMLGGIDSIDGSWLGTRAEKRETVNSPVRRRKASILRVSGHVPGIAGDGCGVNLYTGCAKRLTRCIMQIISRRSEAKC